MYTQDEVLDELRRGNLDNLYQEGCLSIEDVRLAYRRGWITKETAISWAEVLLKNKIVQICKNNPTCKDSNGVPCPYYEKFKGCYFRGKTPREWKLDELKKGVENERV